jgi:hypothetical protein
LQIYEPTKIPKGLPRQIDNTFGFATIDGRLGQGHAALVEAICFCAESFTRMPDDKVEVLVDLYKIRISMGSGKYHSFEGLFTRAKELMKALIELKINLSGEHIIFHIIEKMEKSIKEVRYDPLNPSLKRNLWVVTFSKEYIHLLKNDLELYYDPRPIAKLSSGITQAIARYLLTHRRQPNGGWILDHLFTSVGASTSKNEQIRKYRDRIRKDAKKLLFVGFQLTEDTKGRLRIKKAPKPLGLGD